MYKYRFSIFTATYNRASRLEDLAEMINNQLFKGPYEWVIVNDGSTDNTVDVVSNIMKNCNVPIKFINKGNGGKHTAWREATKVFEGDTLSLVMMMTRLRLICLKSLTNIGKCLKNPLAMTHFGKCVHDHNMRMVDWWDLSCLSHILILTIMK